MNRFERDAVIWMTMRASRVGVYVVGITVLALLLAGCQSGHRKPETFYESLLVANAWGIAAADTVNDARRTGLIDRDLHMRALDVLEESQRYLQWAREAYQAGNLILAGSNLDRAESVMSLALALVAPHLADTPENRALLERYGHAGATP